MKVSIVNVQAPFVRGGAEYLADSLAVRIRERGHDVDQVKIPFKWYPAKTILDHMFSCRLMNTTCGQSDLAIALKFPAYLAPAPRKKLWLLHQFRQVYEQWGTEISGLEDNAENRALRDTVHRMDNRHLPEAEAIYTNSHTVAGRLKRFNNIDADKVLFPPLDRPELFQPGEFADYFFYPSRLNPAKRQHIAVEAMRFVKSPFKLVLAGNPDSEAYGRQIEETIQKYNLQDRVIRLGWVTEEEKARWMKNALAAVYLPYDEDSYGYVTLEAFHSHKTVLSFTDSGGVRELITHGENGFLLDPTPEALAEAMESLWKNKPRARELGAAAHETLLANNIHWDHILDHLLAQLMRIGWFTPYYAVSAIGGYSAAVVEGLLARGHEVTVFAPNDSRFGGIRETAHRTVAIDSAYDPKIGAQLDRLDVIAYNFGNHFPFHGGIYEYAAKKPGIAILHDVVLRDFFWGWSAALTGSLEPLIALFRHWHGAEAAAYVGKRIADGLPLSVDDPTVLKWPLVAPVIANSLGAIAHSRFAQQRVSAETSREIIALDFPLFGPIVGRSQEEPPAKPPRDKQRILTFGVLNPNKRIDLTIQAFGASELLRQHATFDVIGGGTPEYVQELQQKINALNLQDHIRLLGRQPDEVLVEKLFDADIVVNLRNPHMGESSASLVDSLLAGAPTVVWNHGSYQEFPDEIVCRISHDRELLPALERLISDPVNRQERAASGRRHALERFNTENYCHNFEVFAERLMSRRPAAELIDRVSSVLKEMRAVPTDACTLKIRDIMHCMTNDPPPHSRSGAPPVPRSKAA